MTQTIVCVMDDAKYPMVGQCGKHNKALSIADENALFIFECTATHIQKRILNSGREPT